MPAPKKKAPKKSAPATPCPIGSPSHGMKDPAVIRWNLENRPTEMESIYPPTFDWRAALANDPNNQ